MAHKAFMFQLFTEKITQGRFKGENMLTQDIVP